MDRKRKILIAVIVLTLLFIWGRSVKDRQESEQESRWVVVLLETVFGQGNVPETLIRKTAHFVEYAVLGAELMLFFNNVPLATAHCLFTGAVDETIQYFTQRGSMLLDVWLDTAGGLFGAVLTLALFLLKKRRADAQTLIEQSQAIPDPGSGEREEQCRRPMKEK